MKFDVLIVTHEKDFNKLPFVIDSIKNNIIGFDLIFCITNIPVKDKIKDVIYYLDSDVFKFDLFSRINNTNRIGWYKQQYIKLMQDITKDKYLVIDADTIILNKLDIFEKEKPIFFFGKDQEHHPYFEMITSLFGYGKLYPKSFINEIMLFDRNYIEEMFMDCFNTFFGSVKESFIEVTTNLINKINHNTSSFSEYETYGTWVYKNHPNEYMQRQLKCMNLGMKKLYKEKEILYFSELYKSKGFDKLSLHTWI